MHKSTLRAAVRSLRPDWSAEQFDAHWLAFVRLKAGVAKARRRHAARLARKG